VYFSPRTASKSLRVERAVDQRLARFDVFAFLHVNVHAADDGVFLLRFAVLRFDVNLRKPLLIRRISRRRRFR